MTRRSLHAAAAVAALGLPAAVLAQQPDYAMPAPAQAQPPLKPLEPRPALRRAAVIDVARGRVRFRLPSEDRYRRLVGPTTVPMQTIVDTREGRVRLTVARDRRGRTSRGVFYDGRFRIAQGAGERPITHLRLVGDVESACASARASAARKPRRRRLWGNGKGRFRTRGRYSAATVRGTKWLVEDLCDGTLTRVARGEVEVVDFSTDSPSAPETQSDALGTPAPSAGSAPARPRKVRVRRGGSYVARPGG